MENCGFLSMEKAGQRVYLQALIWATVGNGKTPCCTGGETSGWSAQVKKSETRVVMEIREQENMQNLYWGNEYIKCDSRHEMGN